MLQDVLSRLSHVKQHGSYFMCDCPVGVHKTPSNTLSVKESDGKVLITCHGGCETSEVVKAIGLKLSDLFEQTERPKPTGLTLVQYAEAKKLPVDFLQDCGLKDAQWFGLPAVEIPYKDIQGKTVATRYRISMTGDKFRWAKGNSPIIYGLWRKIKDYVVFVEGESDAQTLWMHDFISLGLPGASNWKETWSKYFDNVKVIFVIVEPDMGGDTVRKRLAPSILAPKLRSVSLGSYYKDPSGLYLSDPEVFKERFKAILKTSLHNKLRGRAWKPEDGLASNPAYQNECAG